MMESDWNGEKDDHTNTFAYQPNHSINNHNNNHHNAAYQQSREGDMDYLDGLNSALLGNAFSVDDGSPPGPWIHDFLGESFFSQLDDELFQFV